VGVTRQWVMNGALTALLCSIGIAQQTAPSGTMPLEAIIQSIQRAQAAARPQASYQIIREYRLFGAKDSKADSEVWQKSISGHPPSKATGFRAPRAAVEGSNLFAVFWTMKSKQHPRTGRQAAPSAEITTV